MKIAMGVCLALSILLLPVATWAVEPLALYDDFKAPAPGSGQVVWNRGAQ